MGCFGSKENPPASASASAGFNDTPTKTVDPRLPFASYRQLFNFKNSWKTITRNLKTTAISTFTRFLKECPEHIDAHGRLKAAENWESSDALVDESNELFDLLDEAVEGMDSAKLNSAISSLNAYGRKMKLSEAYLKDLKPRFLVGCGETLGDRFTDPTKENFSLMFDFCTKEILQGASG